MGIGSITGLICGLVILGSVTGAATPEVSRSGAHPILTANPNPVPAGYGLGATQISWDVGDGTTGKVLVSVDGADPTVFAGDPRGSAPAPWIRTGSRYAFRLYGETTAGAPLAAVEVTRPPATLLTAAPNPVPAGYGPGSTEISWDVGAEAAGKVLVSVDGAEPTEFASGRQGSAQAPWIRAGAHYEFRLYGETPSGTPLASVEVTRAAATILTAAPNPVPPGDGPGTTEISWDVGYGTTGRVLASVDGGEPTDIASGPRGSSMVSWIYTGSTYEFRLYGEGASDVPLASIKVTRRTREVRYFQLIVLAGAVVAFVVAVLILRRVWREIGPGVFLMALLWAWRI